MAKTSSKKSTESFDIIEESPAPRSKKTSSDSSSSAGGGKGVFNSRILLSTLSVVLGIVVIILTILLCIQPKETFTKTKKTSIGYLGEFNDDDNEFILSNDFVENMRKLMGIKKYADGEIKAWQLPFSESELIKMYLTYEFTIQLEQMNSHLSSCFEFVDDLKYSDFNNTFFNIEYNYKKSKLHAIISFFINSSVYEKNIAIPQSIVIDFTLYDFKLIPYTIPSDNLDSNAWLTGIELSNIVKAFNFYYYASSRSNGNCYINYSDYIESNVYYPIGYINESPDKYFSNKLYTSKFTSFFVSSEIQYKEFPKLKTIVINNENEPDQWTEYLKGYHFDKLDDYLSDIPTLATIASNDKLIKDFIKDIYSPVYADGEEHPEINIYDYISGFKEQSFRDIASNTPDIQLYKDRATFYFKINNNIQNLDLDNDIEWKVIGNNKPITITTDSGIMESVTWAELKEKDYFSEELANYIKTGFIDCWSNPDSAYSIVPVNSSTRGYNTYNRTIFSLSNKLVYDSNINWNYDWSISGANDLPDGISSIQFDFGQGGYSNSLISYVNKDNIELCYQMPWSTKTDGTEYFSSPYFYRPSIDLIEFFSSTLDQSESALILGNLIDYTKLSLS